MHNYVATAQPSTCVSHCATGNFTSPDVRNLIVGKCTRFEVHTIAEEGLVPVIEVPINGRISSLFLFRPKGEAQDLLFVATEKRKFFVVRYDSIEKEFISIANGDLSDRVGREDDFVMTDVDPKCQLIGAHLYTGCFKALPIEKKHGSTSFGEAFNMRLEESQVLDIKFLQGYKEDGKMKECRGPTICVLYEDTRGRHLKTYEISMSDKELKETKFSQTSVDGGANKIVPIEMPLGGVVILGEQTIAYLDGEEHKAISTLPALNQAYGFVDNYRILIGDHLGKLRILVLQNNNHVVEQLVVDTLGETSIAECLSYLDNNYVFVGSCSGDSHLIRLNNDMDNDGSYIEIIENYTNIGPILDFCVVDVEKQGQGQLITCSGTFKDGSLRIIRNGIGIEEHASIPLPGVEGLWSLRDSINSHYEKYLVMSFPGESRVLGIENSELKEMCPAGFDMNTATLVCGNAVNDTVVQVTEREVRLVRCDTMELCDSWEMPLEGKINVADCNPSQVVVAATGGNIFYLEVEDLKLVEKNKKQLEYEVACLTINPLEKGSFKSDFCALGMWTDISVRILSLPDFHDMQTEKLEGDIIPRSVIFSCLDDVNYLFCALGDGHVFSFKFDGNDVSLSDKRKLLLGSQPVVLKEFEARGCWNVLACSDRPTVIHSVSQKLTFSSVNVKDVSHMCSFSCEDFPESFAFLSEDTLIVGALDEIQKLHIRTVPLGEQPRRIAYHEESKCVVVGTEKINYDPSGTEVEECFVRLFDDQTFESVFSFTLNSFERASSVCVCPVGKDSLLCVVIGTGEIKPDEEGCTSGRILVFEVIDRQLVLIAQEVVKGCVYRVSPFKDMLLSGINNQLYTWKFVANADKQYELEEDCHTAAHVLVNSLSVKGEFILAGDIMKSVSLFVYRTDEGDSVLEERARDYNMCWTTSIHMVDDEAFIASDMQMNLLSFSRNADSASEEDQKRLNVVGQYHVGDAVNIIRPGSLVMRTSEADSLSNVQTLLYATVSGSIGVIISLPKDLFEFMERIQTAAAEVVCGVGGLDHASFRMFNGIHPDKRQSCKGFVDGDLIENILDMRRDRVVEVASKMGQNIKADDMVKRVEDLYLLH